MDTGRMNLPDARTRLVAVAHETHARGWVPATSGNFSARLANGDIAITVSGKDKGKLASGDVMRISVDGKAEGHLKPSAETRLHLQLYDRDIGINAVLHTHSVNSIVATRSGSGQIRFQDLEILKAFAGIETHAASITIPVFDNNQDIEALAGEVERHMTAHGQGIAYLIAGHGVYTWGADVDECMRHLEALEYLFDYDRLSQSGAAGNE